MSHEDIARTFDAWAEAGRDAKMEEGHGNVVRQVIDQMDIRAGDRVLDLGCGNGWATRLLAQTQAGVQAIGIDVSPQMIVKADELHSFTIRARYDLGTFENLDFKDGHFQRIFSMEALYYAPDLDKALAETRRVLAEGGTLDVVVDFYEEAPETAHWGDEVGVTMHYLSETDWKQRLEAAGFRDVEARRVRDTRRDENAPGSLWLHATR
jgi:ubiquinone/menaquinone biosynthesis C-methylase UbiE